MNYVKSNARPWVFPSIATMAFLLLLMHESELPAVFNRYSIHYTLLLILYALNLGLLWWRSLLRVSYERLIERLRPGPLVSVLISVISVLFLLDFVIGIELPQKTSDWISSGLLGILILQVEVLREEPIFMSSHLALGGCSLAITVILVESIFVLFLLENRNPKTHREFLELMTSSTLRDDAAWPQPISVPKPAGTFRILGLSDSFGTTGGTTSNYNYLLEDLLRRDVSSMIEMVNVSVPGSTLLHQLAILRFGMGYSPDFVLHGFVLNDFWLGKEDVYMYRGILAYRDPSTFRFRPRNFMIGNWIKNVLIGLQEERRRQDELKRGIVGRISGFSKSTYLKYQFVRINDWAKRGEEGVERMKKVFPVLDAIRSRAEEGGGYYVMVIHPDHVQVDDKLRRDVVTTFQINDEEYDFELPQKILRSYCEDRGIVCLDLLPSFRAKVKHGDLYLLRNNHYNQTGNELAAASIRQFLRDRRLLPGIRRTTPSQVQAGQ